MKPTSSGSRGRPRDDSARGRILDAAMDLASSESYHGITVEAIAARAKTGKQTIYRWWPSKGELLLEALVRLATAQIPIREESDPEERLRLFLRATFRTVQGNVGKLLTALVAESIHDPEFKQVHFERLIQVRREALKAAVGTLASDDHERDLIVDTIFGIMWYRLIFSHAPLDDRLADDLVEMTRKIGN